MRISSTNSNPVGVKETIELLHRERKGTGVVSCMNHFAGPNHSAFSITPRLSSSLSRNVLQQSYKGTQCL